MSNEIMIERLGRASRVSGLLMALGALGVAIALWLSYRQLRSLQGEVKSLYSQIGDLQKEANSLKTEGDQLRKNNRNLRQDSEKLRLEIGGLREALSASRYAIEAFHQHNYAAAVSLYDQALRADPNNAYLLNLKAYSQFKLKDTRQAIETEKQSLLVDPEYAWGYFDLARFECAAGSFGPARKAIDAALQKRPELRGVMDKDGEFQRLCHPILK